MRVSIASLLLLTLACDAPSEAPLGDTAEGRDTSEHGDTAEHGDTSEHGDTAEERASANETSDDPSAAPRAVIEARDELGNLVRLERPAERIASLLPSHTQTLIALGVAHRLVARDSYSELPPGMQDVPDVGALQPNVELLSMLEPDLVLATEYETQSSVLLRAGLTVYAGSPQRYRDVFSSIRTTARLTGREQRGEEIVRTIEREIALIESQLAETPIRKVYFEIDSTLYSVGPRSYLGTLIAKAGGRTVVPETLPDFPQLSAEMILAENPEVILGVSLEDVRRRPGWSRLAAVEAERVYSFSDAERDVVVRAGPHVAEGLRVLARRIHPEVELADEPQ